MIKLKKLLTEAEPPKQKPPAGGGDTPEKPQKLKINIPDSPFEPDPGEIIDSLKQVLKQWELKQYPSDVHRWKEYFIDIKKLIAKFEGEPPK